MQLSPDRILVPRSGERLSGSQGVHRHARRRYGDAAGRVSAVHELRYDADPRPDAPGVGTVGCRVHACRCSSVAAPGRRRGEVGAAPAPGLVAGRHGRPDPDQRAHSRRHDGDSRCLFSGAHARAVCAGAGSAIHRGSRRCRHAGAGGMQRTYAARHQACPCLLHGEPDRVYVSRARGRRVVCGHFSFRDPCVLQGSVVPRRRRDH